MNKMKKLLILLSCFVCALGISAQDKTVPATLKAGQDYHSFSLKSSDSITTNLDTVDYQVKYVGNYVKKVAIHVEVDTIAGADTISVQLLGYDFADDATGNIIIAADTTNVASITNIILTDDYFSAADEFSFRYYAIRIRHLGVGKGVLVKEVELKLYTE